MIKNTYAENMKILMVGPDINGHGGISRVCKIWEKSQLFEEYNIDYIPSVKEENANKSFFLLKAIINFICKIKKNNCIVYIHTSSNRSFFRKAIFIVISRVFRKSIILHIHPTHFINFLNNISKFKRVFCLKLLNRINAFVVLTDYVKKEIYKLSNNPKIFVLPNVVDPAMIKTNHQVQRFENKLLYLGWYIKAKGVYDLVDAIKIVKQKNVAVELECYGIKQIEELRKYVQKSELENCIKVNGWANEKLKESSLRKSTALILPSYSEGMPNVILEAMSTETPIISSSVGGLKEVLKDEINAIIIRPGDAEDIADKIIYCLNNRQLRLRMSKEALKNAKKEYSVKMLKKVFSSIIKETEKSVGRK